MRLCASDIYLAFPPNNCSDPRLETVALGSAIAVIFSSQLVAASILPEKAELGSVASSSEMIYGSGPASVVAPRADEVGRGRQGTSGACRYIDIGPVSHSCLGREIPTTYLPLMHLPLIHLPLMHEPITQNQQNCTNLQCFHQNSSSSSRGRT